ncbi:MarR family winged helix-turn-helix transcriptional regulator [Zavarzinia sp. CC-PAN008]|uniref:MarR family winged helix-turn-helix transcriptional regulator n=1 Tax=Zavarzinia sp. CC-PAN008 TaxID=3243332 RepID=UPI003F749899
MTLRTPDEPAHDADADAPVLPARDGDLRQGHVHAVRSIVALYREFEQAARPSDISMAQYRAMLYLRSGARRAGEVAAALAVKKPTISAVLATLRDKGWTVERSDPVDGRVVRVVMTPAGLARLAAFESDLADRLGALLPGVDLPAMLAVFEGVYAALAATRDERLKDLEETA